MKLTLSRLKKLFQGNWVAWIICFSAIFLTSISQWVGVFDTLELKIYDYRFNTVRGPLTGWTAIDSSYINRGTDVVLVEVDDEAWRLVPEEWPYPRGSIWARVIRNLYKAGAKVIVFDIQFDSPENRSEIYKDLIESTTADYIINQVPSLRDTSEAENILKSLPMLIPRHGDDMLGEAVAEAQMFGTTVIMPAKMVTEPTSVPPQYISYPVNQVMAANLADKDHSWVLQASGEYKKHDYRDNEERFSCHQYFIENPSLSGRGQAAGNPPPNLLNLNISNN